MWYIPIFPPQLLEKKTTHTHKKPRVKLVKQYGGINVQETIKRKLSGQFK